MSKVAKRYTFAGLPIAVENPAGSERVWPGDGGVERKTVMRNDYGFVEGTEGTDGDEIDVYVGPSPTARFAYVVRQLQRPGYDKHDEDKVFVGFDSEEAARACFLAHRDDGDLAYGGMTSIPIGEFVRKIEARTGAGRIRHEGNPHELAAVIMERRGLFELAIGRSLAFDASRGADGIVRAQVWDRGMTFGEKVKDGQLSSFNVDSFGQMMSNWLRRGEIISLCYNHQSAYVAQNGQPAPALAKYDAVAMVHGGQVLRFERLHSSSAMAAPSVLELQKRVASLATDLDPLPSPDGLWFFRCEVTPLGQELLPNYSYISPMFTSKGKDELGNDQGYTIIDLAATNTAFQAGCIIAFDREASPPKVVTMAVSEDINGREIRRGARVRVVTDGTTATVIGDPNEIKVDLSNGETAHPRKLMVLEGFSAARARVLERKTLVLDFRRGRQRLLERRRLTVGLTLMEIRVGDRVRHRNVSYRDNGRVIDWDQDRNAFIVRWPDGQEDRLPESLLVKYAKA